MCGEKNSYNIKKLWIPLRLRNVFDCVRYIMHFNTSILNCITLFAGNTAKAEKQEEKVHL